MQFSRPGRLKKTEGNGFSFVELLLVIAAVGFLVVLLGSIPNSLNLIGKSKHESLAREILSKEIEDKRNITYANLVLGETNISDSRLVLLPSGEGKTLIEDCNPSICTNGENAKQVTVTVTWKEAGKLQTAKIKTLTGEGGLNQ